MIQINSIQQQLLLCPPFSAPRGSGVQLRMGRSPTPPGVMSRRLSSCHHGSPGGLWAGHRSFGSGRAIDGGQPTGIAAVSREQSTSSDVMATSHGSPDSSSARVRAASHGEASTSGSESRMAPEATPPALYSMDDRDSIRVSWETLMRWSKTLRSRNSAKDHVLDDTDKVVVMGGGSFGTAMAAVLAENKPSLDVTILLRDVFLAADINETHCNTRYLPGFTLPSNVRATTDAGEAIDAAGYALHAVPVQASRRFLESVKALLPMHVPVISVSKGLEVETGQMMSELIPSALNRDQPTVFVSGPSFAREVIQQKPTCVLAASRDPDLAAAAQQLFANEYLRVNTSTDVTGVEVCGALKNVLAIAAGIVEGQGLGNNALAALICQGCAEIRWLAERMGARPETVSGLSGLGDIMLTCYGSLSRNRTVGMQLGQGRHLNQILSQSSQVAEGVATAGVVVKLARTYRVSLPVLTAVASVLDGELTAKQAVDEIMLLPQLEER